ncbi:MAG: biosynthetic-type acetolactate synthase large subunit [Candidatus Sumerlaeia bacterium]
MKTQTEAQPEAAKQTMAGQTMSGADMILQVLAEEGVDTIFGYSGGSILPTYDAVFRYNKARDEDEGDPIRLIVPANEQGATFMAAGYARSSGKVGVALVTSGPGATNTVTPVRDCAADSIPLVLICGQVPRSVIGTDAFQEAPVSTLMASCAKHVFLVTNPEELEATIRSAFFIARTGRPGPVVIDIPKDVQNWTGEYRGEGLLEMRGYRHYLKKIENSRLSQESAATFFKMLAASERPLLYVGGGVILGNATDELRQFMDRFQIPAVNTLTGIGATDPANPLTLHMIGMHGAAYANYAVEDCDFLIVVGARFDDRVAGKVAAFAPNVKYIAHIDIDATEIDKIKKAQWAHIGDAGQTLRDLMAAGKKFRKDFGEWHRHLAGLKAEYGMAYDRENELIQPYAVIECLQELAGPDAIVATGVGQHQMWAAQYYRIGQPRHFLTSGSMGTMGFGLPAAIGAQAANPGRTVIDIDGDGSIRMNIGEMETASTYELPVKIVLLNNLGDGMVRQWQRMYFGERFSGSDKSMHTKDFVRAAEADGYGFARRITQPEEIRPAIEAMLAYDEGPALLEVMIDPNASVYPIVGPGLGYTEMVTGEFIRKRPAPAAPQKVEISALPDLF